ncbi:hypothetical protein I4U23_020087 [Adineta vaga]|nr:hypothetical protein I4U23_020087 [Adineta vaga]
MAKPHFYQQLSIDDSTDAMENYEDIYYDEFYSFLFDHLLQSIKHIPFDDIIKTQLQSNNSVYKTKESNSLYWLYRADRKLIHTVTIYSFRFANSCHPDLYRIFEIKRHHLFKQVSEPRHKFVGWYTYIGKELLNHIAAFLKLERIVQNQRHHYIKLFIHQEQERLDIQFHFPSMNERIAICFEPGYPADGEE